MLRIIMSISGREAVILTRDSEFVRFYSPRDNMLGSGNRSGKL